MRSFCRSDKKLGVLRFEPSGRISDPRREGNGALGVLVSVKAEAERRDAVTLVLCEVHQLLAVTEVHEAQFGEEVGRLG